MHDESHIQNNKAILCTRLRVRKMVQEIKGMEGVSYADEIVLLISQKFKSTKSVPFLGQHWTFEVVSEGVWLKPMP